MVEDRQTIVLMTNHASLYNCSTEIFILILLGVASNPLGLHEYSMGVAGSVRMNGAPACVNFGYLV